MSKEKKIEDILLKIIENLDKKDNSSHFTLKERVQEIYQSMLNIHKRIDNEFPILKKQIHEDIEFHNLEIRKEILNMQININKIAEKSNDNEKKLYAFNIVLAVAVILIQIFWK